jgi:hypothetical protein
MNEHLNFYRISGLTLNDVDSFLDEFMAVNDDVNSVSFSYTQYDDGAECGLRTTIEKNSYRIEE